MNYYVINTDNEIVLVNSDRKVLHDTLEHLPQYQSCEILETDREIIMLDDKFVFADEHQDDIERKERERIGELTLTAADVERAIYKAKGMDFEDVIEYVKNSGYVGLDVKSLKIELKANNFYRKHPYIDAIGMILGYTSEDMDYLFEHKELPST